MSLFKGQIPLYLLNGLYKTIMWLQNLKLFKDALLKINSVT